MKSNSPIRILFLTRYDYEAASSRQRFVQFKPYLKSLGIECEIQPFFWSGYLKDRFESNKVSLFYYLLLAYGKRAIKLRSAKDYDLLFAQMELFPYFPRIIEKIILPIEIPCIYDYDDAWFYSYSEHQNNIIRKFLGTKISDVMHEALGVIVGSTYLYSYAKQYQYDVTLIPTSIDLNRYPSLPPTLDPQAPFTIGWIGSPTTTPFLHQISDILKKFCSTHRAKVILIGAGSQSLDIPNLTSIEWMEESEVAEISKFDVGIMPLPDTSFTRAKCAFKLIQYMGCWKPVIASNVGENNIVVDHGVNGFLAGNQDDWLNSLNELYKNRELGKTMGINGRAKVEREYCLEVTAPQLARVLKQSIMRYKHDKNIS